MKPKPAPLLLTHRTTMGLLGNPPRSTYERWIKKGIIQTKPFGLQTRVTRASIERLIERPLTRKDLEPLK